MFYDSKAYIRITYIYKTNSDTKTLSFKSRLIKKKTRAYILVRQVFHNENNVCNTM